MCGFARKRKGHLALQNLLILSCISSIALPSVGRMSVCGNDPLCRAKPLSPWISVQKLLLVNTQDAEMIFLCDAHDWSVRLEPMHASWNKEGYPHLRATHSSDISRRPSTWLSPVCEKISTFTGFGLAFRISHTASSLACGDHNLSGGQQNNCSHILATGKSRIAYSQVAVPALFTFWTPVKPHLDTEGPANHRKESSGNLTDTNIQLQHDSVRQARLLTEDRSYKTTKVLDAVGGTATRIVLGRLLASTNTVAL